MGRRGVMTIAEMEAIVIDDILKEPVQKRINAAIKDKENELKDKENELKNKEKELKNKEDELKDKDSIIASQKKEFKRYMRLFAKELGADGVIDILKKANPKLKKKDLKRIKKLIR